MSEPCTGPANLSQDQLYSINQQNLNIQKDAFRANQDQFHTSAAYAHQEAMAAKMQPPVEVLGSLLIIGATVFVLVSRAIRASVEVRSARNSANIEIAKVTPKLNMDDLNSTLERIADALEEKTGTQD